MSDGGAATVSASMRPTAVFICAASHSGSTLLGLLLGSHGDALSLGEITQMPKNLALNTRCSCGDLIRDCTFWSNVIDRLARLERFARIRERPYDLYLGLFKAGTVIDVHHQTPLRELYRRLAYSAAYARWRSRLLPAAVTAPLVEGARNKHELYRTVASIAARSVVVDSSKHYCEAVTLYQTAPDRTKVVLLVRDGRAVFYSGLKRGWPRRKALNAWLNTYRRGLPLLESEIGAGDLLRVSYESLAADPARELQKICEFIGVPFDPEMLDFRSRVHHVLNGNNMRLGNSSAIKVDAAWASQLARDDLEYFERRAGALNRSLGYS